MLALPLMHAALRVLVVTAALSLVGLPAAGHEQSSAEDEAGGLSKITYKSGRALVIFPPGTIFPPYIADPHRPGSAILYELYTSTDIEGTGDNRFYLKIGGRFGLLRWLPKTSQGRIWQLSLEAGLDAQFDGEHDQDNIGWDGNYGLSLTTTRNEGRLGLKLGILHTSAHIGDEIIERTGRERIGYTREEFQTAISLKLGSRWRTYAEAAWGYKRRNEVLMKPGRAQAGVEVEVPRSLWDDLAGWYVALDLSSWEERDWRVDVSVQAGLRFDSLRRVWRLGVQYTDGRVPLGEFFEHTEAAISFGLWSEL